MLCPCCSGGSQPPTYRAGQHQPPRFHRNKTNEASVGSLSCRTQTLQTHIHIHLRNPHPHPRRVLDPNQFALFYPVLFHRQSGPLHSAALTGRGHFYSRLLYQIN